MEYKRVEENEEEGGTQRLYKMWKANTRKMRIQETTRGSALVDLAAVETEL
jgi:hypothetical protein